MRFIPLYLLVLLAVSLRAQENLVINYSFEDLSDSISKPAPANPIQVAQGWSSPNSGSPKLYTTVNQYIYDEYGSSWKFKARTGAHVAAMYVYGGFGETETRGYIQGSLEKPLTVGQRYDFSFWVHYHCAGSNNIGIAFLPEEINLSEPGTIPLQPATYQEEVTLYNEEKTWTKVEGSFVAYKPFKNFVIGNFFSNDDTETQSPGYGHFFAYIDDITVAASSEEVTEITEVDLAQEKEKWEYNEVAVLEDKLTEKGVPDPAAAAEALLKMAMVPVFFDFDSAELTEASQEKLVTLASHIQANTSVKILVSGHASSEGTEAYNQYLGEKRAKQVKSFLIGNGVNGDQLTVESKGETIPVADNETEEQRKENRRVTFEIIEE